MIIFLNIPLIMEFTVRRLGRVGSGEVGSGNKSVYKDKMHVTQENIRKLLEKDNYNRRIQ
jgi:hypothetical protein